MIEDKRKSIDGLLEELTRGTGLGVMRHAGESLFHVEDRDAMFFRLAILETRDNGLSFARAEIDGTSLHGPTEALISDVTGKVLEVRREYARCLRDAADRMDPK